jgi:hypothetical protein
MWTRRNINGTRYFNRTFLKPPYGKKKTMKNKRTMKSRVIALVCVLALVTAGTPQCFASTDPGMIVADVVLARPFCFVATIIGSAFFVISLPVAATSKSVHKSARALVIKPAQATFTRPLGEFQDMSD